MPKHKKGRVGVKVDMTPMVDVAFLLLTFFMLTTQFKPPEEVSIILPSSHAPFKLPESDVMTVSISKDSRIFMGVDQQPLMARLFGEVARLKPSVEVPIKDLPNLLIQARIANPKLRTVIRGDKETEYGTVMDVMDILQKTQITRFNLVTDLTPERETKQ
jgi:biopolymer transport protein ExbD